MALYEIIWGDQRRKSRFNASSKADAVKRFRGWHPKAKIKRVTLIRADIQANGYNISLRW